MRDEEEEKGDGQSCFDMWRGRRGLIVCWRKSKLFLRAVNVVSVRTSLDVIPGGDHVARFDAEQVKDIDENVKLCTAIGIKINPRRWVKKHESQVGNHDKLKVVVLHDDDVRRFI